MLSLHSLAIDGFSCKIIEVWLILVLNPSIKMANVTNNVNRNVIIIGPGRIMLRCVEFLKPNIKIHVHPCLHNFRLTLIHCQDIH